MVTMGRLDAEAKTTMSFLMRKGQSKSEVARLLGVTEGTVRYHAKRKASGAVDGRSNQKSKVEPFAVPIADWHGQHNEAGVSLPALYAWLRDEHGFAGSLRAVQMGWLPPSPDGIVTCQDLACRPRAERTAK